jgi:signal transduction histidine kinase
MVAGKTSVIMAAKLTQAACRRIARSAELCRPRSAEKDHQRGDSRPWRRRYSHRVGASAHRLLAARPGSRTLVDVGLAAAALAGSLALLSHGGIRFGASEPESGELDWIGGLLAACSTVPLLAWRRAPGAVFVLTASASVLLAGLGYSLGLPLGPSAALFLFVASRDERDPWTRRRSGMVVALFLGYLGAAALGDGGFPWSELVHGGLAWAAAWFAGDRTRLRREQLAELEERALRAEREGERERRLAAAEERARIARDLHDSAGHAINVIAIRAGTARLRQDPERSQAALEAIEELARQTVAEIDQIVGRLRERRSGNGAVDAPPGLASLDPLLARHAAAGLEVRVASAGEPRRLERAVDQAAYRILQEALTNVARHGAGAARVELAFGEAALELAISNAAPAHSLSRPNGGHGLIGMRERATLLGGSLEVERAHGSFCVRARLPYAGPRA